MKHWPQDGIKERTPLRYALVTDASTSPVTSSGPVPQDVLPQIHQHPSADVSSTSVMLPTKTTEHTPSTTSNRIPGFTPVSHNGTFQPSPTTKIIHGPMPSSPHTDKTTGRVTFHPSVPSQPIGPTASGSTFQNRSTPGSIPSPNPRIGPRSHSSYPQSVPSLMTSYHPPALGSSGS